MRVEVTTCSAITVINAIVAEAGAAIGTEIPTRVKVTPSSSTTITCPQGVSDKLVRRCIKDFSETYSVEVQCEVTTDSILPPARGLKTSSAISTGIFLALHTAYNIPADPRIIVEESARSSIAEGVSITGAYDDAYASLLGGFVMTRGAELMHMAEPPTGKVILLVPEKDNPKMSVVERLKGINTDHLKKGVVFARQGKLFEAITLNSDAYGPLLSEDYHLLADIQAKAKGLNGAGPSLFLIDPEDSLSSIRETFRHYNVFVTSFRSPPTLLKS